MPGNYKQPFMRVKKMRKEKRGVTIYDGRGEGLIAGEVMRLMGKELGVKLKYDDTMGSDFGWKLTGDDKAIKKLRAVYERWSKGFKDTEACWYITEKEIAEFNSEHDEGEE